MKKNYVVSLMLFALVTINANAQFVQIDGKNPIFHIKFDSLTADESRLFNAGTDQFAFTKSDGTEVNDTTEGHGWGGGLWSGFTFEDQEVKQRDLPTMFWDSYLSYPTRPQGIAGYSRNSGGYMGAFAGEAITISFYVNATDSVRSDTANGSWGNPYFFGCGNWQVAGERIYMNFDPSTMKIWIDFAQGNWTSYGENVLPKNQWAHVALTIPAGGARTDMKLYVDGVEVFVDEEAGDMTVINLMPENVGWDGIRVGALSNLWMADYRIYDAVLSGSEVAKFVEAPVGVKNTQSNNEFKAYPVPNNGVFTVEFSDNETRNITIINMLGQPVHSQAIKRNGTINVKNLPKGTYFISVQGANKNRITRKISID